MVALHPEFVVDEKNAKKAVMLPLIEWQQVMEELEELEDIRCYDDAKAKASDPIPFETVIKQMNLGERM